MRFQKVLSFFIITVMIVLPLSGCGAAEGNSGETTVGESAVSSDQTENTTDNLLPPAPPTADLGGRQMRFIISNYASYKPLDVTDIDVSETTGEILNDAAFMRDTKIQEQLNCEIVATQYPDQNTMMSTLKKSVAAGDDQFDIAIVRSCSFLTAITGHMLYDLSNLGTVNFDNPWWDKATFDALSFGKHHYGTTGDITVADKITTWNVYFNKQMIRDYSLDDPYKLVEEGKWTIDKMYEMGKAVAADVNSDGVRDTKDRYGITHIMDATTSLLNSFGVKFGDIDKDGKPIFTLNTEDAYNKFVHITELLTDHDTWFNAHKRANPPSAYEANMFVNNQALFSLGGIYYGPEMRAMETEFGILPYPKFNEDQKEYYNAAVVIAIPLVTVPITITDPQSIGMFLENYAYEGHISVRPAFYDVLLQRKVARDNESQAMLDFIFGNPFIDIGAIYNFASISSNINENGATGKKDIVSYIEKNTPKIQADIDKLITAMDE